MGYRSNLMVLIYPDSANVQETIDRYGQLKTLMATTFKGMMDEFFHSCMEWMDSDQVLKFDIRDVKWYPSYPDVQAFEAMLDMFGDHGNGNEIPGFCVEYIRIGEEVEDNEERHTGDANQYYLSIRREIDCNV